MKWRISCLGKKFMTYSLYMIGCKANGFIYIGQTKLPVHKRCYTHKSQLRNNCHDNPHLQNAFLKYGESEFVFNTIVECETQETLDELEIQYIADMRKHNRCFNIQNGGNGPDKVSEETKARLSAALKGKPKSPEHVAKVSAALTGKKRPPPTPEARVNMSAAAKGKPKSPEHCAKLRGRPCLPETRAKLSISKMGELNPMFGKIPRNTGIPPSEETTAKNREAHLKFIYTLKSPMGKLVTTNNIIQLARDENLTSTHLYDLFNGKKGYKSHKGWTAVSRISMETPND